MDLLNLNDFEHDGIMKLINNAISYKSGNFESRLKGKIVGLLFFEPSTRTHYSFDVAAKKLGIQTINFEAENSSLLKGESFVDTIKTFESFDLDALIIRDSKFEYYNELNEIDTPIINAGDGSGNHPTQSLLDLMTIYEEFGSFKGLKIAIIGDIKHSRVARTNYYILNKLGAKVNFVSASALKGDYGEYKEMDELITSVDVVMLLRVQLERHIGKFSSEDYNQRYGLNLAKMKLMKKEAIIMHPAPFNIGVELTEDVLEDDRCRIFAQSKNGVYMRMAVLNEYIK